MLSSYASPYPILRAAAEAFRPPRRVSVSEGATNALMLKHPGGYYAPWSNAEAPYMVEPMNMLASRNHEAVVFVGPARSGKTAGLLDGWMSHAICNDPGDMLIVQMTQEKAREYSKTRIDRAIRNSPEIKSRMSMRRSDDNTHDKLTKHGMWIKIGWPSATQLASTDYRYVAMTDYDRFPDDIDGEGSGFVLGLKRTQAALSRGKFMCESSPGRDMADPFFRKSTPHEAPPVTGILGIYNISDRRRWYWRCLDCFEYFEAAPGLSLFSSLPPDSELVEIVRSENLQKLALKHAFVCCPKCGTQIAHENKRHLNSLKTARWVADGQAVTSDGEVIGDFPQSPIAGYWLGGVAAAYQRWDSILLGYFQGLREYVLSGSETTLKSKTNVDQAMPYLPRLFAEESGDQAEDRAVDIDRFIVPEWTRFILAGVDVQGGHKSRFVVQVHAIGVDMESTILDRYDITESPRGNDIRIDPASYPEDWDALTQRVVLSTYRYKPDQELRVLHTIVDYGGEAGVSVQAAAWRRKLKAIGLAHRVTLGKGDGQMQNMVTRTYARNQNSKKMLDVPLLLFSADKFKDLVAASMRRSEPGPAYMHFPQWLKQWFYDELRAEVRQPNGKWKKIRTRNEALDLWQMIWALAYSLGPADTRRLFNWDNPPAWAKPLPDNSELVSPDDRRAEKEKYKPVKHESAMNRMLRTRRGTGRREKWR